MRGEDAGERRGCDATMSFKYHGKQGPAVIRMPAQVPRGNIYQDGEIGGRKTRPIPRWEKERKEDRMGWINSKKRGSLSRARARDGKD